MMSRYTFVALFLTVVIFASTVDVADAGSLRAAAAVTVEKQKTDDTSTGVKNIDTAKKIEAKSRSFRNEVLHDNKAPAAARPADRHRKVVISRRTTATNGPVTTEMTERKTKMTKEDATNKINKDDGEIKKKHSGNNRRTIDQDRRAKIVRRRDESLNAKKKKTVSSTTTLKTLKFVASEQQQQEDENDVWNNMLTDNDAPLHPESTADEDEYDETAVKNNVAAARIKTEQRAQAFRDQVRAAMTMKESFKA